MGPAPLVRRSSSPAAIAANAEPGPAFADSGRYSPVASSIGYPRFGHRERHDLRVGRGDPLDERGRVGRGVHEIDDAADHLHIGVVVTARDQGVQVILPPEDGRHLGVARKHAGADDRPVGVSESAELVDVGGEVGAVEPADADVDDAAPKPDTVVPRDVDRRGQVPQGICFQWVSGRGRRHSADSIST